MEKSYSVIIPHKNVPSLLKRCLASIPIRNDIQVIVVDDNSRNDLSAEAEKICKLYHSSFIKTTKGGGAGYARNVGLSRVVGKWVLFADADDFFHYNAFDVLDRFADSDVDVVYFYCDSKYSDTLEPDKDRVPAIKEGIEKKDYDLLRFKSSVPWGKLISNNTIKSNGLNFEEVIASNDIMFSARLGACAKKIEVEPQTLYCVTTRAGSLYSRPSPERMKSRFFASIRVNKFLYSIGEEKYRNEPLRDLFYFFPSDLPFFFKNLMLYKSTEPWRRFIPQLFDTISLNVKLYIKRKGLWRK